MNRILLTILILLFYSKSVSQKKEITSLGIPNFTILGSNEDVEKYKWLEVGFSESLTDAFSRVPEFSLIERNQLQKIINEQNLQSSKQIDTLSIVKVGKILGVKQILVGSCQIITGHSLVNMRIVNVETGEIKPLKNLPTIVTRIDSILFLQKKLCVEVLNQFKVNNQKKVIENIEIATSLSTSDIKAYEFLNKGLELYNNGQFKDAIEMYSNALTIDKKYQKAYYRRGESNVKINNYDDAINDYKKVENYVRKDSIFSLIGEAYFKNGDKEKSAEYLTKAQKINPDNKYVKNLISDLNSIPTIKKKLEDLNVDNTETFYEFNNGIARFKKNKKFGFVDLNNKIVVPLIFDDLRDFKNGLAAAKTNSKWGFINKDGNYVIKPQYSDVSDFDKNGLSKVLQKIKWGIINKSGNTVVPIEFENECYTYPTWQSEDFIKVCKSKGILGVNQVCGIYDNKGKEVLPIIYDDVDFENDYVNGYYGEKYKYFHVSFNQKWGVVDHENKIIIPFVYDNGDCIRKIKHNYAPVKVNERWGFTNNRGILAIPTAYEKVNDFNGKMFEVRNKGKWGLINLDLKQNLSCDYEKIEFVESKGYYILTKEGKIGIISLDFSQNLPCDYQKIEFVELREYYKIKKDGKWGIFDLNFKPILSCEYEEIEFLSKSYFKVKNNGKYGVVDKNNKLVLPCEYEDFKYITFEILGAKMNGKWGIIDNLNNIICNFKYDNIIYSNLMEKTEKSKSFVYIEVESNGKKFWINNKCKCISGCE